VAVLLLAALTLLAALIVVVIIGHRVVQANALRRDHEFYEALLQSSREPQRPEKRRPARSRRPS
jgi:hypothetical protein